MAIPIQAARAEDFIQSIGVNTHLGATTTSYGNISAVESQLAYLGVDHVRDVAPSAATLAAYEAVGTLGTTFDLIVMGDPAQAMSSLDAMAPYLTSVEGSNEVNVSPVSYQGLTGAAAAVALQIALYADVHNDQALNGNGRATPVLNFSLSPGGSSAPYGNMSAYADYTNVHDYGQNGVPPYWYLQAEINGTTDTPGRPAIVTETGNYTTPDHASGVNEDVQAKWTLDTLLDDFKNGVAMTYLYQLEDGVADPAGTIREDHYGLYNVDGTPKEAAIALHNLTTLLADTGTQSQTFAPATLQYSLSGLPASGNQELIEKSDGTFDLVLWAEPQIWNTTTNQEIAVAAAPVTVTLAQTYQSISVYDPLLGTAPIATYTNTNRIQVALTDHPLIISIAAPPSNPPDGASGSITLTSTGNVITGGTLPLTVTDNQGGNTIAGGGGAFSITATVGNDVIATGTSASNSVILGGSGADTVTTYGSATVTGNAGLLDLIGNGDLTVSGGSGTLLLTGKAGNESITTLANTMNSLTLSNGADKVVSGGADTIHAGGGSDTVVATGPVQLFANSGTLFFTAGAGASTVTSGLGTASITGGSGNLTVALVSGGNSVTGGAGALAVTDSGGNNTITGGAGGLSLTASAGGDIITTNGTATVSSVILGTGTDTVIANGTTNIIGNHANLAVRGDGTLSVNGGTGNLTLTGGAGSEYVYTQTGTKNLINFGGGNDTISSHGADTINAGAGPGFVYAVGAVLVNGGAGPVTVNGYAGAITVNGGAGAVLASAGAGGGYLQGGSNGGNRLSAAAGNATLVAGGNGDTLTDTGTTGGNTLIAGPGAETLTGGTAGADLFVLTQSSLAHGEVIKGFTPGTDHLHFVGFGATPPIASQTVVGGNLQLTLADNAKVTFIGITSLGSGDIV